MSTPYQYSEQRSKVFTERGVVILLWMIRKIDGLCDDSGAFVADNLLKHFDWMELAVFDYLLELRYIVRLSSPEQPEESPGQYMAYTRPKDIFGVPGPVILRTKNPGKDFDAGAFTSLGLVLSIADRLGTK